MPADLPLAEKLKNAEQFVAYCLKNFPETRGDDRALMIKVWDLQGFRFPKKLIPFFYKVFSPETIQRCRQKIQSEGLFLPEKQKIAERSLFAMESREYWRKNGGK
ncbi:MAG: hypothetical protein ABIN00_08170 [candidate division WOR-3 bacterium]